MIRNILDRFRAIQNVNSLGAYQVTCHLFKKEKENFEAFGTGVFIQIEQNYFLLTVAHVAEGLDFELYVGIEKNTMFRLGGNIVTNNTSNRDKDRFDLCVLKLCQETVLNISDAYRFLNIDEIQLNHEFKELPTYQLLGFPVTRSKYNHFKKKLYSKSYRFITSAVVDNDIYTKLKCEKAFNVLLNYNRKKVYSITKKTIQIGPELHGVSGCGLWHTPITEIKSKTKPKKYLVAIITEWPVNHRNYLIATRIDLFTEIIRQHFKIDIPKSNIIFKVN